MNKLKQWWLKNKKTTNKFEPTEQTIISIYFDEL